MEQHERDQVQTHQTKTEKAAEERLRKYKETVGTYRAADIDKAAEFIADAMAAWMQATKWGMFPGLDPGMVAVTALSRVHEENAENYRAEALRRTPR